MIPVIKGALLYVTFNFIDFEKASYIKIPLVTRISILLCNHVYVFDTFIDIHRVVLQPGDVIKRLDTTHHISYRNVLTKVQHVSDV